MKNTILALLFGGLLILAILLSLTWNSDPGASHPELGNSAGVPDAIAPMSAVDLAQDDAPVLSSDGERTSVAEEAKREKDKKNLSAAARKVGPRYVGRITNSVGMALRDASVYVSKSRDDEGTMIFAMMGATGFPDDPEELAVSDHQGRFVLFRKALSEEVQIEVRARGYLILREKRLEERVGDERRLGDFALESGVVIAGQIIDDRGTPVVGAKVRRVKEEASGREIMMEQFMSQLSGMGLMKMGGVAETNEGGYFSLDYERAGKYTLNIECEGHLPATFQGETPAAGGELVGQIWTLPRGSIIQGILTGIPAQREGIKISVSRVVKNGDEDDISNAISEMFGNGDAVEVDEDGAFEIQGLAIDADYKLRAYEAIGPFQKTNLSDAVTVHAGASGVELEFNGGSTLKFNVIDSVTKKPITQLAVNHRIKGERQGMMGMPFGGQGKLKSWPAGEVALTELRPSEDPGNLQLDITSPGYFETSRKDVEIPMRGELHIGVIEMDPAPRISVRVLDNRNNKPVKKALVSLKGEYDEDGENIDWENGNPFSRPKSTKTNDQGRCEVFAFEAPAFTLTVRRRGFAPYRLEGLSLLGKSDHEFEVRLRQGGEVEVQVRDTFGKPAVGVSIEHRGPGVGGSSKTRRNGSAVFDNLAVGEHRFRAGGDNQAARRRIVIQGEQDDAEDDGWSRVDVIEDLEAVVELVVPARGFLIGVVRAGGQLLRGANISLFSPDEKDAFETSGRTGGFGGGGSKSGRSSTDGRYSIEDIQAGSYAVRITHPDRAMSARVEVEIKGGENKLNITLADTAIEGYVLDEKGHPVQGARVNVYPAPAEGEEDGSSRRRMGFAFMGGGDTGSVHTDSDGRFRLEGVIHSRKLVVEADAVSYVNAESRQVTLVEGETLQGLKITLPHGGTLRVAVQGTTGSFDFVQVDFQGEADPAPDTEIARVRDGVAYFKGLAPGSWKVKMSRSDYEEDVEQLVEIVVGQEANATLVR